MLLRDCLNYLFREYERLGVQYCILRNYEKLPEENIGADIDMLIERKAFKMNYEIILKMATHYNFHYINVIKRQYMTRYFLFKFKDNNIFSLALDFHQDEEWKGAIYLCGEEILSGERQFKNFYIPSPTQEAFISWLSPLLSGGLIKDKYRYAILSNAQKGMETFSKLCINAFGEKLTQQLTPFFESGKLDETVKFRKKIIFSLYLNNVKKRTIKFLSNLALFYLHEIKLRLFATRYFLSIIGPDGTGKTTIINALTDLFVDVFKTKHSNICVFHFRPLLLPNLKKLFSLGRHKGIEEDFTKPHRAKPSGVILSIFRLLYYFIDYTIGYLIKVKPLFARNKIVIFDRYYYDFIVDPARARIKLPKIIPITLMKLLPMPAIVIFLDNKAEIIYKRKQELPIEEISRQLVEYNNLTYKYSCFYKVDSSKAVSEIAKEIACEFVKRITSPLNITQ
ncbi:MAG: hypothetical protein RDU01_04805 [Thermodesulfovibrionales bacterium]|nr:hypothetical protein [Thermodesulfovibrionales bacterium]